MAIPQPPFKVDAASTSSPSPLLQTASSSSSVPSERSTFFHALSPFANVYNGFVRWKRSLDLPSPGTVENLQKEVKSAYAFISSLFGCFLRECLTNTRTETLDTHLTNFMFDGARADLTKGLSMHNVPEILLITGIQIPQYLEIPASKA